MFTFSVHFDFFQSEKSSTDVKKSTESSKDKKVKTDKKVKERLAEKIKGNVLVTEAMF